MAHPRKKRRTQAPGSTQNAQAAGVNKTNPASRTPKSMVIRMGASDVGPSITQLVKDTRSVMEPHTATRLKERRSNRLRDYTTMAGPLGVTHFLLFSRSSNGNTNLRVAITPRGPTLTFRVERYSLAKDVARAQRRPKSAGGGVEHLTPPLLVMNNFTTPADASNPSNATNPIPKHLETLTTSVFQSLFPSINPQRTPLTSIRRVLLLNRERSSSDATYTLSLRHYAITTKPLVPLSRGLRRLRAATDFATKRKLKAQPSSTTSAGTGKTARGGALPDMSRLDDVADYLLDPSGAGYTSASESEVDTDAEVEILETKARRVLSRKDRDRAREAATANGADGAARKENTRSAAQKRAVKLTEIGPRMTLRLLKVEEGLCDGKVMWHEFVTKSAAEAREMEAVWEARRAEREERKRVQKENVERKMKKGGKKGGEGEEDEEDGEVYEGYDEDMDYGDDFLRDDEDDDAEDGAGAVHDEDVDVEEEEEDEEEDEDEDEMEEE